MNVEKAIQEALPKARMTPTKTGMRVRVPGAGRGRRGGAWALVVVNNGNARFHMGLKTSPVYDDPADLAKDLAHQFTKTASTYTG